MIEILKRMSYIFPSGKDLGLGSSGLSLQTSLLRADVKSSMIDNGGCLAKGLPVTPCVIEIVPGFGRGPERCKFESPMMPLIGVVYLDTLSLILLMKKGLLFQCQSEATVRNTR